MPSVDSKNRFSSRVADYVRARLGYPPGVMKLFREEMSLTAASIIADVGSGTGISAKLFLKNGNVVYCVEPNAPMREAAEKYLADYSGFRSITGSAEATGLADASVDFIVCAQAFHWFDPSKTRLQFRRILKKQGWIALMWNERQKTGSRFLECYEQLLHRFGTDYCKIGHENLGEQRIADFLGTNMRVAKFPNAQSVDLAGLRGRVFSSSYMPLQGEHGYDELSRELNKLFSDEHQRGIVTIGYETLVYYAPGSTL
jgi:SAM-dependent methyltransferase